MYFSLFEKGIIAILDTILLFNINNIDGESIITCASFVDYRSEISSNSLSILLSLLGHSNPLFYSQAYVRIHALLICHPFSGPEEAAYLLSNVNNVFSSIFNIGNSKNYADLLSLMKIIFRKSFNLLQINTITSTILFEKAKLEDLRQCFSSTDVEEWNMFIRKITEPYVQHYQSMSVKPFQMNMKLWWNNCHEMMITGMHKRNEQIKIEKQNFQVNKNELFVNKEHKVKDFLEAYC